MRSIKESIIGKRGSTGFGNLPLEYDNLLTVGNVITIYNEDDHKESDYIVFTKDTCNIHEIVAARKYIFKDDDYILLGYTTPNNYLYWRNITNIMFDRKRFPVSNEFKNVKVTNMRGTIPLSEIKNVVTVRDLGIIFEKYKLTPAI